ncbi:MAG: PQQ-like beta-propeller repeat protein [Planctomycetes bacterium]|nr:PQQ-like beta-propeller repeat protein [Planctomycetota bacterium]
MNKAFLAVPCGLLFATIALADDWPNFRGPDLNGISREKGLLKAWPKGGPKLAWTFKDAGLGHSSVSIAKGVVYTLGTDAKFTEEYVIAIDEKSGTELWRARVGPLYTYQGNAYGDGPRSTPTVDGHLLFALGGLGDLVCLDAAKKGKEVWRVSLPKDLDSEIMDKYGYSESPLVDGDLLICTPGGKNGTLAALDKKTGKVQWRSAKLTNSATFSSPIVATLGGVRQYIQTSYNSKAGDIQGVLTGFSPKDGAVLWSEKILGGANDGISATPLVSKNSVYVSSGFGGGCHLFEISKKQIATEKYKKLLWKKVKNRQGGVVLIDGHVYGHSENRMWFCQNLQSGRLEWDERITLSCESGGITAAGGQLYLYTDEGVAALVNPNPEAGELKIVSSLTIPIRSKIPQQRLTSRNSKVWAIPVVANGNLYLRDHEYIFAFKLTK